MISNAAKFIEGIFDALNHRFFNDEVIRPVITIQSTPAAYGHCSILPIWEDGEEKRHELNLGAETLNREIVEVAATLVHEMTHLWNIAHGVKDCSRGNTYHNKLFKAEAEKRGLIIEHHQTYGWTITKPAQDLIDFCKSEGWDKVGMNRGALTPQSGTAKPTAPAGGAKKTKKSSSIKWVCPKCGAIVRSTKVLKIICGDCDVEFEAES